MRYEEHVHVTAPASAHHKLGAIERFQQLGQLALWALCLLIAFRFLLLMAGVNPENPFAEVVLLLSYPLVAPFISLFGEVPQVGRSILEFGDLVALAVYLLMGWGMGWLFRLMTAPTDPSGAAYRV